MSANLPKVAIAAILVYTGFGLIDVAAARAHLPLRELELASEMERLIPRDRVYSQVSDAVAAFKAYADRGIHEG